MNVVTPLVLAGSVALFAYVWISIAGHDRDEQIRVDLLGLLADNPSVLWSTDLLVAATDLDAHVVAEFMDSLAAVGWVKQLWVVDGPSRDPRWVLDVDVDVVLEEIGEAV